MLKKYITAEEVVSLLNELLDIDREAIEALIKNRVDCNNKMVTHDTVQVNMSNGQNPKVGFLGIVNGMFGKTYKGEGCIVAVYEDVDLTRIKKFICNAY